MRKFKFLTGIIAVALLAACSPKLQLTETKKQLYPISEEIKPDVAITSYYQPYKQKLDSMMNDVVVVSSKEIQKAQPEGPLNNFFADAMYQSAKDWNIKFDFAYTNYGGLRIPLPKGNIYRYKIFELMPFENAFTLVTFKGEDVQAFFNYLAEGGGDPISGAKFTIDNKKAIDISINGVAFDITKNYTVLTSDYMANGGDGGAIFNKAIARTDLTYKLRDALFQYLEKKQKAGETLNPVKDGRITIK
ncbi:5'-nucleotidase C-terminal domain-containing protein [Pedobacter alpinus]|uniref:5'-nucleotidase C-terminal domain-containing protein n=1 Tax=Pedobacter alpinus TaxID=1590643 RepID=A0ABW5TR40_9SPHI